MKQSVNGLKSNVQGATKLFEEMSKSQMIVLKAYWTCTIWKAKSY